MTLPRYKVLLIEDSITDARLLRRTLQTSSTAGLEVIHVDTLAFGIERAAEGDIDVVLLDLSLPDSVGLETFERFAAQAPPVAIVVLSGLHDEATALRAVQLGAQDYLVKGSDTLQLLNRSLQYAIQRFQSRQQIREQTEQLRLITEQLPAVIWTTDLDSRITSFSGAGLRDWNLTPAAAVGQSITDYFQPEQDAGLLAEAHRIAAQGAPRTFDLRWRDRILHIHVEPFRRRNGQLRGTIGIALDITEQMLVDLELRFARRVQEDLRPRVAPPIDGFEIGGASRASAAAGGDFHDYFRLADDAVGVVVCDVGGHGLGAAMLMCQTRAYLRALALNECELAQLLTKVNRFLCSDSREGRIVPMFLARLVPHSSQIAYASAGHCGYVLRKDGAAEPLEYTGIPLNVAAEAEYDAEETQLNPGDLVLMTTDGIVESTSPEGDVFGVERMLELVRNHRQRPVQEIVDSLFLAVHDFTGKQTLDDDMTAVVIRAIAV